MSEFTFRTPWRGLLPPQLWTQSYISSPSFKKDYKFLHDRQLEIQDALSTHYGLDKQRIEMEAERAKGSQEHSELYTLLRLWWGYGVQMRERERASGMERAELVK